MQIMKLLILIKGVFAGALFSNNLDTLSHTLKLFENQIKINWGSHISSHSERTEESILL